MSVIRILSAYQVNDAGGKTCSEHCITREPIPLLDRVIGGCQRVRVPLLNKKIKLNKQAWFWYKLRVVDCNVIFYAVWKSTREY